MGRFSRDESPLRKEFEYDDRLEDVTRALENLERPGGGFVSGSFSTFPLPAVQYRRSGEPLEFVQLPFDAIAAQRVNAASHLGHGEEANVDTSVWNTRELSASQHAITNPQWEAFIDDIINDNRESLGIGESAKVEAQQFKLLVHGEGGKIERHQDSEKEPSVFGTLVVVLPGAFAGGELMVDDSAASKGGRHVWCPAEESVYDVKYAAFYGDCALEAMPVTRGYRLCLTYNLVTTTVEDVPRFAGSYRVEESIQSALTEFFTEPLAAKRQKNGWPKKPSTPASHRPFVYVLDNRYWGDKLLFENLKGKDLLVAQNLVKFCEKSEGQHGLYLSNLLYTHESSVDAMYYEAKITVTLENPWVKYGSTRETKCPDLAVEHLEVVAPSGYLETSYDNCETRYPETSKWYKCRALVILPIAVEFDQLVEAAPEAAAAMLSKLVETGSPDVRDFAEEAIAHEKDWTNNAPAYATFLETVMILDDVSLLFDLLLNVRGFEFQPMLRDAVLHFGWDLCLPELLATGQWTMTRIRINLASSVLHNETDVTRISAILDAYDVTLATVEPLKQPHDLCKRPVSPDERPTADEFARILTLAHRASHDTLMRHMRTSNDDTFINLLVPAFLAFVATLPAIDPVMSVIQLLCDQLRARVPALRNTDFSQVKADHDCAKCRVIQAFLMSDTQEKETIVGEDENETKHIESVLERTCQDGSSTLSFRVVAPFTIEVTKEFGEEELHQEALRALEGLEGLCRPPTLTLGMPPRKRQRIAT